MLSCDGRTCLLQISLEHRQTALSSSGFFLSLIGNCGYAKLLRDPSHPIPSHKFFAAALVMADWAFPSECQGVFPQPTCHSTAQLQSVLTGAVTYWHGAVDSAVQVDSCSPDLIVYDSLLILQEERDLLASDCDPCWHTYKDTFFYSNTRQMLAWIPFCSIKLT